MGPPLVITETSGSLVHAVLFQAAWLYPGRRATEASPYLGCRARSLAGQVPRTSRGCKHHRSACPCSAKIPSTLEPGWRAACRGAQPAAALRRPVDFSVYSFLFSILCEYQRMSRKEAGTKDISEYTRHKKSSSQTPVLCSQPHTRDTAGWFTGLPVPHRPRLLMHSNL